jgi:hypothetical protein
MFHQCHPAASLHPALSFYYAIPADCNGNVKTGIVTLQFVQAVVAKPDQFFYYTSPASFPASAGLLQNDVVPGSCAGTTPTFAVVTPPTSGTVVVRTEANCSSKHIISGLPATSKHIICLIVAGNPDA